MKIEHGYILSYLKQYLKANPGIRFGQALGNLDINQFADPINPGNKEYLLRDIYHDSDEKIIKRIKDQEAKTPKS